MLPPTVPRNGPLAGYGKLDLYNRLAIRCCLRERMLWQFIVTLYGPKQ
jgi:hypothetical protein